MSIPRSDSPDPDTVDAIRKAVDPERIVGIARELISVPSPTRSAGAAADKLAELLSGAGFDVERRIAGWPEAPAIVVRLNAPRPGPILQFDGHLDTVHLPFVPPRFEEGRLHGSGASDMKGGLAAAVEALLVLHEQDAIHRGGVLLTAHEHHEGPWGDLRQVRALIREGIHGDAVLLPEYLADRLPVAGRGSVIFHLEITRTGEPVHEIARPPDMPDVLAAGIEVMNELYALDARIEAVRSPVAGRDSVFVGRIHSGEIYNQSPTMCTIDGIRRWVTPGQTDKVTNDLRNLIDGVAARTGTEIRTDMDVRGDAFTLDVQQPFVTAFQSAHKAVSGRGLPQGDKPFVDDGNQFTAHGIPAITHGPAGTGAHTTQESVPLTELVRVAQVYALTAIGFCNAATLTDSTSNQP